MGDAGSASFPAESEKYETYMQRFRNTDTGKASVQRAAKVAKARRKALNILADRHETEFDQIFAAVKREMKL